MRSYQELLRKVMTRGDHRMERTNTGARSLFGEQLRVYLHHGFPLLTTKQMGIKTIIHELLWFLKGDTNVKYLRDNGVKIWDPWASETGDLGPVYGAQWRRWPNYKQNFETSQGQVFAGIDQISAVIRSLKTDPYGRRHVVSAWNPADLPDMALPPCHCLFQFFVSSDRRLSCHLYQRSADIFIGVPYNLASYALLTMMVARVCELKLGELIMSVGDIHLYDNHAIQASEQLTRKPNSPPLLWINPNVTDIDGFTIDDFRLDHYQAHPPLRAPVAV